MLLASIVQSGVVFAHYEGPFLFWGVSDLKNLEVSALEDLNDKFLRDLYSNSAAVVLFLRNGTIKLNDDDFPGFRKILEKEEYVYTAQHELSSNPLDYNVNAEIINLVGSPSQQDVELSALYRDSVSNYGERKVLGILANRWDEPHHGLHKREAKADDASSSTSTTPAGPTDEPEIDDAIYNAQGKALIYITSAPVLTIGTNSSDDKIKLSKHTLATYDERDRESRVIVTFKLEGTSKLTLKFRFEIDSGYWSMSKVDVFSIDKDGSKSIDTTLLIDGNAPYAPLGSSYSCSKQLNFRNGTIALTLENIQVQPALEENTKFGSAWDCIGFTTAPIWSGIFVTSFMAVGLSIAICAILDIKPPNRFESRTGKQLTFTVQE